jgi:hypothetical protein
MPEKSQILGPSNVEKALTAHKIHQGKECIPNPPRSSPSPDPDPDPDSDSDSDPGPVIVPDIDPTALNFVNFLHMFNKSKNGFSNEDDDYENHSYDDSLGILGDVDDEEDDSDDKASVHEGARTRMAGKTYTALDFQFLKKEWLEVDAGVIFDKSSDEISSSS